MSPPPDPTPVDSLPDPASLLDHPEIGVETTEESVDAEDFAAAEAWTDHVAVGVADDRGVLCYDDGHHGWTLPAFEVTDDADDVLAVARREFEALTGVPIVVDGVEHARRRRFSVAGDGGAADRETSVWNVILCATPTAPVADDPEDGPDVVAADIERIADQPTTETPTVTDSTTDPIESLTDPDALRDRDGVEYLSETEADHFGQDDGVAGVAVVALTDDDGALAFASFEDVTILPHAVVETGEDYATVACDAARDLLGVDVELDDVVRVRRKDSPAGETDGDVAHVVVFAASAVGDGGLSDADDVASCQAESTGWSEHVPDDLQTEEMRADAALFLD